MCFMSGSIEMENVFIHENEVGVWQWFFGKAVTSVVFHNPGPSDGFVGISAPSLGRILPVCPSNCQVLRCLFFFILCCKASDPKFWFNTTSHWFVICLVWCLFVLQIDLAKFGGEILCQVKLIHTFVCVPGFADNNLVF